MDKPIEKRSLKMCTNRWEDSVGIACKELGVNVRIGWNQCKIEIIAKKCCENPWFSYACIYCLIIRVQDELSSFSRYVPFFVVGCNVILVCVLLRAAESQVPFTRQLEELLI